MSKNNQLIIYQGRSGAIEFKGDFQKDTLWASQAQICSLFGIDQSVASRHINNIFKDKEIDSKSNMQKMHNANSDKPVIFYSLDLILAIGYRTNSRIAISFRQWATKTLKQHIVEGYTINKKRLAKNYGEFLRTVDNLKKLLPVSNQIQAGDALELIKMFAGTWFSLDAYDRGGLPKFGSIKKSVLVTTEELSSDLNKLKIELMSKNEASDLFGRENANGNLDGIVGAVFQSYGGEYLYPTLEEKAAHLLYFMVKNHPFNDGNKRSGAFAFVWFLKRAKLLDYSKLSPEALTALTLLIAESDPNKKDLMIGLVMQLIKMK